MRLRDVQGVGEILATSSFGTDPLWDKELEGVKEESITLFYARASIAGMRKEAIDLIEAVQSAVIVAAFHGEKAAGVSAIIMHVPPPDPFMVDEFVTRLAKLSQARCRACLYALVTRSAPPAVTALTWNDLPQGRSHLPVLAREILDECARTRHIRLPYVFWEWATNKIAAPLMDLQGTIEVAFCCTWPELVEKHDRMIKVNRSSDSTSFMQLADEVRRGHL
jgi:hypothetical protein